MTLLLASPLRRALLAAAFAFAVTLAVLVLAGRGDEEPVVAGDPAGVVEGSGEVGRLQAAVRAEPERPDLQAALASAYLQRARETEDPSYYARAGELLRRVLARDPRSLPGLVAAATLANAQHDFRGALALARRARAAAPESVAPYPPLVDALVELGRHGAAERTLQTMIDLKPNLAGYARVSYVRELHGDLDGAVRAMRLAVTAGGSAAENTAAVQVLLGDLELARGRLGAAGRAYAAALAAVPGHVPARAGRARLAAAQGDAAAARAAWRRVVAVRPLPEYASALGEAELAAGNAAEAERQFELVRVQQALLARGGSDVDAELAVHEADHGSPRRAVVLARRAWAAAPGLRAADAMGWALTRAGRPDAGLRWARRALRLGSVDAGFRYHAGLSANAAGRVAEARRHLRVALDHGLAAAPLRAQRARRVLRVGA